MPDRSTPPGEPARPPQPDAGQRLKIALMKPSRRQVAVAVLLAALGFGAVTQARITRFDDEFAGLRQEQLIDLLSSLDGTTQRAETEIAQLQRTRDDLLDTRRQRQAAQQQADQEAQTLSVLAGLVPVTGPGLRITIEETDQPVDIDTVLDTMQELRTAGAEAMEFNDEVRVIASTAFEDAVGGIIVDGAELSPPYIIDVIGDPITLRSSGLDFPFGPMYQLEVQLGADVLVEEQQEVSIDSVVEASDPQYAEATQSQ